MVTTQLPYRVCNGRLIITAQLSIINTSQEGIWGDMTCNDRTGHDTTKHDKTHHAAQVVPSPMGMAVPYILGSHSAE